MMADLERLTVINEGTRANMIAKMDAHKEGMRASRERTEGF
jgi:hypothetical protein